MPSCYDDSFPCQEPQYKEFDRLAAKELNNAPSANRIVNRTDFCTFLPINEAAKIGDLTHADFLRALRDKVGIYHVWIDYENCTDHNTFTMRCLYVGKGLAKARINEYLRDKPTVESNLYVTFHECPNRLAKYLEQLFLDTYYFPQNKNENAGTTNLYAVWSDELHLLGTETNEASAQSRLDSIDDL